MTQQVSLDNKSCLNNKLCLIEFAMSLWHPYAMLMAVGAKKNDTRQWKTFHRGLVAIQASIEFPDWCKELAKAKASFFGQALQQAGIKFSELERTQGHVIAVGYLDKCVSTRAALTKVHPIERCFGDYSEGRFCFMFGSMKRLEEPIPMRAYQRLFRMPDDVRVKIAEQIDLARLIKDGAGKGGVI